MAGAKRAERPLAAGSRATKVRRRSAHVMKPEYLAEIERMRLMDDDKAEEGRHAMCEAIERIAERREARGEARGKRETMIAMAKRMLESGKLMLKEVAEFSGLSLAQVKKLQASMA